MIIRSFLHVSHKNLNNNNVCLLPIVNPFIACTMYDLNAIASRNKWIAHSTIRLSIQCNDLHNKFHSYFKLITPISRMWTFIPLLIHIKKATTGVRIAWLLRQSERKLYLEICPFPFRWLYTTYIKTFLCYSLVVFFLPSNELNLFAQLVKSSRLQKVELDELWKSFDWRVWRKR